MLKTKNVSIYKGNKPVKTDKGNELLAALLLFVGWIVMAQAAMVQEVMVQEVMAENNSAGRNAQNPQSAIQKMAMIMHRLKHFPSPPSKTILQDIIASKTATDREKILATAIFNLNHRALVEDKAKLKKIMENHSASGDERDLAGIIYNLDHRPTKSDKQRLEKMMQ
jgi:hypothetical protein